MIALPRPPRLPPSDIERRDYGGNDPRPEPPRPFHPLLALGLVAVALIGYLIFVAMMAR